MKSRKEKILPQEGSCCSAAGESLTEQSSVCPTSYSGGGTERVKLTTDYYPSVEDALSQGGSRFCDEESLGSLPNTSEASQSQKLAVGRECDSSILASSEVSKSKLAKGTPITPKQVTSRAQFMRPSAAISSGVVSDSGESSCSLMSLKSGASKRPYRASTRKRTEEKANFDNSQSEGGEENGDSERASPPAKQPKTRTKPKQSLPEPELWARTMQTQPTADLSACIKESLKTIEEVAYASRNLKESFVHNHKVAAVTVQAAVEELVKRSAVDVSIERLQAENAELRSRLAGLSTQLEKLTVQVVTLRGQGNLLAGPSMASKPKGFEKAIEAATIPIDDKAALGLTSELETQFRRSIALEIGNMVEAKFATLESRLLPEKPVRPPIASDSKRTAALATQLHPAAALNAVSNTATRKKRKGKGKAVTPVPELLAVSAPSLQRLRAETVTDTWSSKVGRKAKKVVPNTRSGAPSTPSALLTLAKGNKQPVKLPRVPTTAAITVSIREGSSVTLAEVMSAMRQRIQLADLGINVVGQKRAADGGIIISVAGTDSSAKADCLPSSMREILAKSDVRIVQ